jgi:hypothetical protein
MLILDRSPSPPVCIEGGHSIPAASKLSFIEIAQDARGWTFALRLASVEVGDVSRTTTSCPFCIIIGSNNSHCFAIWLPHDTEALGEAD